MLKTGCLVGLGKVNYSKNVGIFMLMFSKTKILHSFKYMPLEWRQHSSYGSHSGLRARKWWQNIVLLLRFYGFTVKGRKLRIMALQTTALVGLLLPLVLPQWPLPGCCGSVPGNGARLTINAIMSDCVLRPASYYRRPGKSLAHVQWLVLHSGHAAAAAITSPHSTPHAPPLHRRGTIVRLYLFGKHFGKIPL